MPCESQTVDLSVLKGQLKKKRAVLLEELRATDVQLRAIDVLIEEGRKPLYGPKAKFTCITCSRMLFKKFFDDGDFESRICRKCFEKAEKKETTIAVEERGQVVLRSKHLQERLCHTCQQKRKFAGIVCDACLLQTTWLNNGKVRCKGCDVPKDLYDLIPGTFNCIHCNGRKK